jgi:hypothetical protein
MLYLFIAHCDLVSGIFSCLYINISNVHPKQYMHVTNPLRALAYDMQTITWETDMICHLAGANLPQARIFSTGQILHNRRVL